MTAIAAVLTAIYGTADISKSVAGDEEALICEEFSVGPSIFFPSADQHPVEKILAASLKKRAGVADAGWDEPLGKTVAPPAETGTLAKRLGIVRTERKEIAGEPWSYAYNAAGELVGVRQIYE